MISASDRQLAVTLIQEAIDAGARKGRACKELGIHPRTFKRWADPNTPDDDQRPHAVRPEPSNKLKQEEEKEILEVLNSPEYQSSPPSQVVPTLADQGIYLASESTMYRILRKHGLQKHRGPAKESQPRPLASHCATGPNQVWMWDISWIPGPIRGMYFYLYLFLDLYSREIVAWELYEEESAENASRLLRKAALAQGISKHQAELILHSDNGGPMRAATFQETLHMLGIVPSRSRPRVSNDNPYAESIFRTCKYRPGFPTKGFKTINEARDWMLGFVRWYNYEHKHGGIQFVTPHQRHTGQDTVILANRKRVYAQACSRHPERWARTPRDWSHQREVWLNPTKESDTQTVG